MSRLILYLVIIILVIASAESSLAQCALCKANAETSVNQGDSTAKGLNAGIMYLLIIPYALVAIIGYWWYSKMYKPGQDEN